MIQDEIKELQAELKDLLGGAQYKKTIQAIKAQLGGTSGSERSTLTHTLLTSVVSEAKKLGFVPTKTVKSSVGPSAIAPLPDPDEEELVQAFLADYTAHQKAIKGTSGQQRNSLNRAFLTKWPENDDARKEGLRRLEITKLAGSQSALSNAKIIDGKEVNIGGKVIQDLSPDSIPTTSASSLADSGGEDDFDLMANVADPDASDLLHDGGSRAESAAQTTKAVSGGAARTDPKAGAKFRENLISRFKKELQSGIAGSHTPDSVALAGMDLIDQLSKADPNTAMTEWGMTSEAAKKLAEKGHNALVGIDPAVGVPAFLDLMLSKSAVVREKFAGILGAHAPETVGTVPPVGTPPPVGPGGSPNVDPAKAAAEAAAANTVRQNMAKGGTPPGEKPPTGGAAAGEEVAANPKMWEWLKSKIGSKGGKMALGIGGVGAATWLLSSLAGGILQSKRDREFDSQWGPSPSEVYLQQAAANRDRDQALQIGGNPQLMMLMKLMEERKQKKAQSAMADLQVPGRYSVDDL